MRNTFVFSAIGLLSYSTSASAQSTNSSSTASYMTCSIDPVYQGLFPSSAIRYDASTYCLSLLNIPPQTFCLSTATTRTTIAFVTMSTRTITAATAQAATTTTVTSTAVVYDIETSQNPQRAVRVRAPMTSTSPRYRRDAALEKRQMGFDLTSALSSACECNPDLSAMTMNMICTSTSTISQAVILRTTTTVYSTVTSGTTTVTDYVNSTSTITTSSVSSSATWTASGGWPDWPNATFTTSTATNITTSTSTSLISTTTSINTTTTTGTVTNTSSTTTMTPTPTPPPCPFNNVTSVPSNQNCYIYQPICGRTYPDSNFFNIEFTSSNPQQCINSCDATIGERCVGIVWNTTAGAPNCRLLRSTDTPLNASDAVALLLVPDPACYTTTTTATTTPYTNITTTTSSNSTSTTMSITSPSSSIITTSNNTCPVTTAYMTNTITVYGTMFNTTTIDPVTTTVTVTVSPTWGNSDLGEVTTVSG